VKTKSGVKLLLDLGLQPISNRYLQDPADEEELFPLKLGQCRETGLIQLIDPVPYEKLTPRYDWVTYNEPESHLDSLVEKVSKLFLKKKDPIIGGISFKDDSTLERFERLGYQTWKIDPIRDLKLGKNAGIESVQAALNVERSKEIVNRNGRADLLVVRHIWEHVYDQYAFAEALKGMIAKDGYLLFEVPDCRNHLDNLDYTMTWEEHLYYYTHNTFKQSLQHHGFEVVYMNVIPYLFEDSLVALAKRQTLRYLENEIEKTELEESRQRGERYATEFGAQKIMIIEYLENEKSDRKLMLFGAGHHACAFINYFSLKDFFECVIDDDPNKQRLFMPKSRLPVVKSEALFNENKALCVFSLMPVHEEKILSRHSEFLQKGGEVRSIFPSSKYYFGNK